MLTGKLEFRGSSVAEPDVAAVWRWTVAPCEVALDYRDGFRQQPDYSSEEAEQYGAGKLSYYSDDQTVLIVSESPHSS